MIQTGQDLPFPPESLAEKIPRQRDVDQFDGNLLLELPVGAMRQVHRAHPAASQNPLELVRTDPAAGLSYSGIRWLTRNVFGRQVFLRVPGLEEGIGLLQEFDVASAELLHKGCSLGGGSIQHPVKHLFRAPPAIDDQFVGRQTRTSTRQVKDGILVRHLGVPPDQDSIRQAGPLAFQS